MKLFSAAQVRAWDAFTIASEPVAAIDLMERAAVACAQWLLDRFPGNTRFQIFCGKGNNGGDGLAIARLLSASGFSSEVFILEQGKAGTAEFQQNLRRLQEGRIPVYYLQEQLPLPQPADGAVMVDALFGSGLSRPLAGFEATLVRHLNRFHHPVVAIDLPSGLPADGVAETDAVVCAEVTLTFERLKLALLLPEHGRYCGSVQILPIGLHPGFEEQEGSCWNYTDAAAAAEIWRPRPRFSHKGNFGHVLLAAGSRGKIGAALLAARACLRSGSGLLTCLVPGCGYTVVQTAAPEAMVLTDPSEERLTMVPDIAAYAAIGVGPGIGTDAQTGRFFEQLLERASSPLVIDADGLNLLAAAPERLKRLPPGTILTPHPREFDRMFGTHHNTLQRLQTARMKTAALNCIIVLKGHHSAIVTPGGQVHFNSTGNAGMAKGGSGDALTGVLAALLAQGYPPAQSALLGVYLHGKAGDLALKDQAPESLLPSDLVEALGTAWQEFSGAQP